MRQLLLIFLGILFCVTHISCATPGEGIDESSALEDELSSDSGLDAELDAELGDELDAELDDESFDLAEGEENFDDMPLEEDNFEEEIAGDLESFDENFENPTDALNDDFVAESEPAESFSNGESVEITAVDFDGTTSDGTITVATTGVPSFSVRKNEEGTQFIIDIQSATLPSKFKRPFDTKEFDSNIGFFQGYQSANSSTARFVIQLREPREPSVVLRGNSIVIASNGGSIEGTPVAIETDSGGNDAIEMTGAPKSQSMWDDSKALNTRTLDEFLMGDSTYYGHPISIEVKDTDVRDVFNFIAEESGLNLVLSESVSGKVTLKLRDIPWDQAFIVLLQAKQLGYVRQGNILRVESLLQIRAETDATRQLLDSQRMLQPMRVQIFPVSYAKAAELESQVREFLSSRGKVKADPRTNALIVTDISESLRKIRRLIAALDTQTPQVLIEGKVVEARESFQQQLGLLLGTAGETNGVLFPGKDIRGSGSELAYNTAGSAIGSASGGDMSINFSVLNLDGVGTLTASLDMLERDEVVRVVSSPRVVTLNNIEALIKQTSELPIFTQTIEDGEVQTSVEYKQLNLQLKVTPQITADGGIIMEMFIERQFAGEEVQNGDTSANPIFGRSAQTTVLVENGQTAVVGGIYQNDITETDIGIPFFRRIPILGSLFSSNSMSKEKNELLIFLTPRVLNREKAFGGIMMGSEAELSKNGAPQE